MKEWGHPVRCFMRLLRTCARSWFTFAVERQIKRRKGQGYEVVYEPLGSYAVDRESELCLCRRQTGANTPVRLPQPQCSLSCPPMKTATGYSEE